MVVFLFALRLIISLYNSFPHNARVGRDFLSVLLRDVQKKLDKYSHAFYNVTDKLEYFNFFHSVFCSVRKEFIYV